MSDDEVTVCPECSDTDIRIVATGAVQTNGQSPGRYHCNACDARFDEPSSREPQSVGGVRGLAGKLADPEVSSIADLDEKERDAA